MSQKLFANYTQRGVDVDPSQIKPDPNQPRKHFDKGYIEELSKNIKEVGIINPIEVDDYGVIITGERRWRAAKLAKLKRVPVKVVQRSSLTGAERYFRQVSENIHHNTMTPYETAVALKKILVGEYKGWDEKSITKLSERLGTSRWTIGKLLLLLEEPEEVQRALRENRLKHTFVIELRSAPPEHQASLRKRLLTGEFDKAGTQAVRMLCRALRTRPEAEARLLSVDYTNLDSTEMRRTIMRYAPTYTETPITDQVRENLRGYEAILKSVAQLTKVLNSNPPASIPEFRRRQAFMQVAALNKSLRAWVNTVPAELREKMLHKLKGGDV